MNMEKLISAKGRQLKENNYIEFSDEELNALRPDEIQHLVERYHGFALMRIPPSEVAFFEWLRDQDEEVWNDIWEGEPDMYLVSTDLLPVFQEGKNGFPICDLVDQPNYWFSERHIKPKGREELEHIVQKYENQGKLNIGELFLIQLLNAPTDIWHFCYRFNISVASMKRVIATMVSNGWLVHLTDRDDLVKYIEI